MTIVAEIVSERGLGAVVVLIDFEIDDDDKEGARFVFDELCVFPVLS